MSEKLTLEWCFKYPKAKINRTDVKTIYRCQYESIYELIDDHISTANSLKELKEIVLLSKLQLRPLSSLTDEEQDNISFDIFDGEDGYLEPTETEMFIHDVDYLRSINIDIDGLHKRGLCIYE